MFSQYRLAGKYIYTDGSTSSSTFSSYIGSIYTLNSTYYEESVLDICDQKRFNASWEVGGTFRYCNFQLGYTYSRGLMNHSYDSAYEVKQNKPMRLNMTLFF